MARKAKPARRRPGTGTIRQKKGRALEWEAAFPLGHGQHRYDSFSSRAQAEEHLDRLTAERDAADTPRDIAGGSTLVSAFFPIWLQSKVKAAPNTLRLYGYLLGLVVGEGELGGYRLDEVTRPVAQAMLAHFSRKQFKNAGQIRAVCRQAFEYALDEHYITSNPFRKVETPEADRRQAVALTEAQRQQLLDTAATSDDPDVPLCILWHLYSRLGLRCGEGLGVRWQDCDLDRAVLTVSGQRTREGNRMSGRKPPKNKETRVVPLPADIVQILRDLRQWQIKRAARQTVASMPEYVFTDEHGAPIKLGRLDRRWVKLKAAAGMPSDLRIHDLRHTAMYLMALAGVPDTIRMKIAGHKTSDMANLYANHATVEDMRRALG